MNVNKIGKEIDAMIKSFPNEHFTGCGYWHLHLPTNREFINSNQTARKIKQECIQALINGAVKLQAIRTENNNETRIVVAVSLPDLFNSQIIVFFGEAYYSKFFKNRDTYAQKWSPVEQKRSLIREWDLKVTRGFVEIGL